MFKKTIKFVLIIFVSILLVTVGIDATDNYDNLSESVIGKMFFGKETGPCPEDMVLVLNDKGDFCIDKYEVSLGENCPYLDPKSEIESRLNIDEIKCQIVSKKGNIPWRNITKTQAMTACAKVGKRLPSLEEWFLASLGTPDKESSWGANDCQVDNNWDIQPGLTGSGENCSSYSGAYDMIGNVWEWVKDEANDGFYDNKELPEAGFVHSVDSAGVPTETDENEEDANHYQDYFWIKKTGLRNIAKGGYWNNKNEAGVYSTYAVAPTSFIGIGIGFRCVK